MTNIFEEQEQVAEWERGEPYDYDKRFREYEITGELAERIIARVATYYYGEQPRVTMVDVDESYGTCDFCGGYGASLIVNVDGHTVWTAEDGWGMEEWEHEPTVYAALEAWLNEDN